MAVGAVIARPMEIIKEKPFVYYILHWLYKVKWENIVIAWNGNLYCSESLPWHLIDHEAVHLRQQGGFFGSCWFFLRYICFKKFRYNKELEAYQNQYESFCSVVKDGNERYKFLVKIAFDLSSGMYGNVCGFEDAKKLIHSLD